jgi:FlaA1/EpsC-like NDP-sugar epimerase
MEDVAVARPSIMATLAAGSRRYGTAFAAEVAVFYAVLVAYQELGYGHRLSPSPPFIGPSLYYVLLGLFMVVVAMGAAEARFRLYRRVWVVAGISDAFALGLAVLEATLLISAANAVIPGDFRPYRMLVPILAAPSVMAAIGAFRLLPRLRNRGLPRAGSRLLIAVYGDRWYATVKALVQYPNAGWTPVAILTSNSADVHQTVMGIPVAGNTADLTRWIAGTKADGVAFVVNNRPVSELHESFAQCLRAELPIFIVPDALDILRPEEAGRLRPLSTDDLVGRSQREIELQATEGRIRGRVILVSGAAGSIGSEICRLLARMSPRRLVIIDNNESGLFDLAVELRVHPDLDVREALVSVTDAGLLGDVFGEECPDVVFHVAAYKHVPMLEAHPEQAVINNVGGTRNMLAAASANGVSEFVLVSTDKAVARHSVMGSSKRLCEQLTMSHQGSMASWSVRFGNVVGSRGSVVPTFERQILAGGPVTVTHPQVTRYMMTIREAASLVITTMQFGRPGRLYMLDMGEPISIVSLAKSLIRSRGLRPGIDIEVAFTGLRPGERMTEDLLLTHEGTRPTAHPAIVEVVSASQRSQESLDQAVDQLLELAHGGHSTDVARALKIATAEPGETPIDEGAIADPKPHLKTVTGHDE